MKIKIINRGKSEGKGNLLSGSTNHFCTGISNHSLNSFNTIVKGKAITVISTVGSNGIHLRTIFYKIN